MSLRAQPPHSRLVERPVYTNVPQQAPDLDGASQAWRLHPPRREGLADIGANWLVRDTTEAHPLFTWYAVSAIHLRVQEGAQPPHVVVPGATHEMVVMTINPKRPLPDLQEANPSCLLPPDFLHQFLCRSDEHARGLVQMLVEHACEGHPLDSDYAFYWRRVLEDTAEHLLYGCHPTNN